MANIGIDVDGVLRNLEQYQLKKGKEFFKNVDTIDETKLEIKDIFNCTVEESEKFWLKNIWEYSLKEPIVKDASDIIALLQKKGHSIHIITQFAHTMQDDFVGKLFRYMLKRFLKINNVNPTSINYCNEMGKENDKLDVCKKLNIDYMIEDNPQNIDILSKYCRVICIKTKYNNNIKDSENIIVVNNFSEVFDTIMNFDNIKNEHNFSKSIFFKDEYSKNYNIARNIGVPLFKVCLHPTIINREYIPQTGPIILCGNHLHVWDQFPVICATNRTTHWMSKKEYFDSQLGTFFRKTGAICVDRNGDTSSSVNTAINYLNIDSAIGIFPEGTRNGLKTVDIDKLYEYGIDMDYDEFKNKLHDLNPLSSHIRLLEELYLNKKISHDDFINSLFDTRQYLKKLVQENIISNDKYEDSELLPFKFGAVSMAKKTKANIVPFAVTGDYKIGNNNLIVSFGEPFRVLDDDLEYVNSQLRQKILKLVKDNRKNI